MNLASLLAALFLFYKSERTHSESLPSFRMNVILKFHFSTFFSLVHSKSYFLRLQVPPVARRSGHEKMASLHLIFRSPFELDLL